MYYVYVVRCADRALYTGITTDVQRRVAEHNRSARGARYTRARRPVKLVYTKKYRTRSTASKAEARMKALPRKEKMKMVGSMGTENLA
jgi:putative endonuclease